MSGERCPSFLLFEAHQCLCAGESEQIAEVLSQRFVDPQRGQLLVFAADSGAQIDLDHSTSAENNAKQLDCLAQQFASDGAPAVRSGPGRPKLGVVAKEVTLLPRHWQWLATQSGGASATLRRLVEQARRDGGEREKQRLARDGTFRFLNTLAGDLPGFEEACRALYAGESERFAAILQSWPADVQQHAARMARLAF